VCPSCLDGGAQGGAPYGANTCLLEGEVGERVGLSADNSLVRALRREDLEVLLSRARAVLYARFMQTEEESAPIGSSSHGGEATARSPHR
jgi:hypothetical protein